MDDTTTLAPTAVDLLWRRLKEDGDASARDGLILHYAALVKFVAGRVGSNLPRSVDQSDLVSYGIFGLIDAIDKFEPERGYKFETYSIPRIRGAILDELRALDWVPRSVRSRAREIDRTVGELEHRLGRTPTDDELADAMSMPVDQLRSYLGEISSTGFVALDESPAGATGEGASLGERLPDPRGINPEAAFHDIEDKRVLADAINRLPERDRLVLTLYYYEGLTLNEIGIVLGVTESRVCQIHTKSVMSLRHRLADRGT